MAKYDDFEGIAWRWQSIDGVMFKAPLAQKAVGRNLTDRGRKGSKRHLLEGRDVPLSPVVTGANAHDVKQLEAVLQATVVNAHDQSSAAPSICRISGQERHEDHLGPRLHHARGGPQERG